VHLAAIVGQPACDKQLSKSHETNVAATEAILKLISKNQILIYPNTNSGYGITEHDTSCDETTPMLPISAYGKQKCLAERMVLNHPKSIVFRLATVFGLSPRPRLDLLVNNFAYRSYFNNAIEVFDGHFRRNYVHVGDVSYAILAAIRNMLPYDVYNLGNDEINMDKQTLASKIARFYGAKVLYGEGSDPDKRDYYVSSDKLRQKGFVASNGLLLGLSELGKFFASLHTEQVIRKEQIKNCFNAGANL
jgi:nucleoside-diphosphate-sugar epimerase